MLTRVPTPLDARELLSGLLGREGHRAGVAGAAIGLMPVGAAEIAIEEAGFGTGKLSIAGLKQPRPRPPGGLSPIGVTRLEASSGLR